MHKRFIFPSVFKNAQRITIIQLALNNRGYIFFTQFIDSIFSGIRHGIFDQLIICNLHLLFTLFIEESP